ncbi:MAG: hypothetical protein ACHQ17_08835 [Polyangia bacterium]
MRWTRLLRALLIAGVLAGAALSAAPAFAQGQENVPVAEQGDRIVNWWSWDYGAKAKDPAHRDWPPPFGFAIVNFLVFAGIMYKLCKKPLRGFLLERHLGIRRDLDEAARLRLEAERQLEEYQRKVENVDGEIETLLGNIRKEAEQEKARIIAAAEAQSARLKADAERQIEAEIARARLELRRGAIEAAISVATKLVESQIGADDQRRMAERYVADLEKSTAPAKSGRPQ